MPVLLLGRATELSALHDDVERTCAGHGRFLMIRGESGIGKTALARALADKALECGSQVVWTTAAVPASAPSPWPWPAVVRALGDDALAESLENGPMGIRRFEDLAAILVRVAAERPVTIVIDDADAMTQVGQDLLAFVGAQLSLRKVMIVATSRRVLEHVERAGTALILQGLSQSAVGELLREHGIVVDDDVVRMVRKGSRGNPADVIALIPALRSVSTPNDVVEALISFAEHEANRGGRRAGDRWIAHACDVAATGEQLARVALLSHALGATTSVSDDDRIELLHEATLQAQEPALRARLLAATAREAYHLDAARDLGDPRELADAAVSLARRVGDPDALAFCLLAKHDTEWRPRSATERLRLANEIVELRPGLEGVLARYVAYLELGDRRMGREFDRFTQLAERDGSAHAQYLLSTRRAMRAIMIGDLASAEHLIDESVQLAKRYGEPDGLVVALNQRFELQSERGNRAELLPLLERARQFSSHAAILASLALARLDANDEIGAQTLVAAYTDVELDLVKPEYGRVWVLAMLGEAFARLGLHDATERAAAAMLPLTGSDVVVGGGVVFHGAVDYHIGVLLTACGRTDAAEPHLRAALAMHERLGALPWIARTAEPLGEHDRARRIRAGRIATSAAMSFDGSVWTIAFAGTTATMKDAKGLRDIARLVISACTEISAADLAGAEDEARFGADATIDDAARRTYRARIDELGQEIERADRAGDRAASEAAVTERERLIGELQAAAGLGGRNRRLGDAGERARKAVTARIRDTIRNIDARHPALAAHLRDSIATGTSCCYRPDPPVKWEIRQI